MIYQVIGLQLTEEQGGILVKLARRAVELFLDTGRRPELKGRFPKGFEAKRGVFVTLRKIIELEDGSRRWILRGCVGYPLPKLPLAKATVNAAIAAATRDPRFPPVIPSELGHLIFEISVLSDLNMITGNPEEIASSIKIGRDGIVVEKGLMKALLLPQVAVEYNWSAEEFLNQACIKAGLPPDAWKSGGVKIYKFQAQVFAEIEPNGRVIERIMYLPDRR